MKLVLSRKGFDSGSGGSLSPYNHQNGKYMVSNTGKGK